MFAHVPDHYLPRTYRPKSPLIVTTQCIHRYNSILSSFTFYAVHGSQLVSMYRPGLVYSGLPLWSEEGQPDGKPRSSKI